MAGDLVRTQIRDGVAGVPLDHPPLHVVVLRGSVYLDLGPRRYTDLDPSSSSHEGELRR
jgi:hypothetical protein